MTKYEKAKELKRSLLEMIAEARKNHRDFDAEQQKQFDDQKNELIALAEELKATEDKLDELEEQIPDVAEEKAEEKPAEGQADVQGEEQEGSEENPAEEEKSADDEEKPAEAPDNAQDEPKDDEQSDTKADSEEPSEELKNDSDESKINNENDSESSDEDVKNPDEDEEKKKETKCKEFYYNKMTNKTNKFSLVGAIRAAADGRQFDDYTAAVIEEGRKQLRASGQSSSAQIILPTEERTITVSDNHDSIIETQFTDILDILNASPVMQKARSLSGLVGDVQVPQILAGTAGEGNVGASWLGENVENTLSHFKFDHRMLSPKRLSTTLLLSKSFIMQDSIGVENAVRKALADSVRQKLETTFLSDEAGTTTKPVGIFYNKNATSVTSFKELCEFEAVAERANYNAPMEYLLSPEAKAEIRSWNYGGGRTGRLVMEGQEIDGTPFISTSNVEAKKFAYINWSDILVATWQGLELEVANDLALQRTNQIALTLSGFFDWMVLRPEAIQYATIEKGSTIDTSTND